MPNAKNITTEEFADYTRFAPDTVLHARRILAIDRMTEALQNIADALRVLNTGNDPNEEIIEGE